MKHLDLEIIVISVTMVVTVALEEVEAIFQFLGREVSRRFEEKS
jgi:hypothetical protein